MISLINTGGIVKVAQIYLSWVCIKIDLSNKYFLCPRKLFCTGINFLALNRSFLD